MTSTGAPPEQGQRAAGSSSDALDTPGLAETLSEYPPSPGEHLRPGSEVGEYLVEELIGEGGFGAVYAARHPVIGKRAAIKVLSKAFSSDAALSARFVNEARAVNTIRHKNIVDIFAFGRLKDERLYFIMEILEGEPLDSYLRRKERLTVVEAMPIFRAVARALDATHAAEIVHRDLKPANIFLSVDGDGDVVPKLLDFGIAKVAGNAASSSSGQTKTGTVLGTPWYMSPEQCRGEGVGPRADVYSFGVMLHRALTGHLPFEGTNAFDVAVAQATMAPPHMSAVAADLPVALDAPVLRMLEKNAADRPRSPGEALDAFAAAAREVGLWGEPDTPGGAPRIDSLIVSSRPRLEGASAARGSEGASAARGSDTEASPTPGKAPRSPVSGGTMPGTEMWAPLKSLTPRHAHSPWRMPVALLAVLALAFVGFTLLQRNAQLAQSVGSPAPATSAPVATSASVTPEPLVSLSTVASASASAVASAVPSAAPSAAGKAKPTKPKSDPDIIPKDFDTPQF